MATSKIFMTLLIVAMAVVFGAGCSDDSPVTPSVIDTAPPAVPSNLTGDLNSHTAVISWAANSVDSDLEGYIVTRDNNGTTDELISTPTMMTSFTDTAVKPGVNTYHVSAVDRAGNRSAVASVTLTRQTGHQTHEMHR
jgi:hypothetical protein